jgi:arsenate reductase
MQASSDKTARKLTLYGIKNCDTMKKAFAWLEAQGIAYDFVDYKKAGVAAAHLPDWNQRAGWKLLLNTRGLMWKKLSEEQRAEINESKALALMAEYPSLIKRPVADCGDGNSLLVGFDVERYSAAFTGDRL